MRGRVSAAQAAAQGVVANHLSGAAGGRPDPPQLVCAYRKVDKNRACVADGRVRSPGPVGLAIYAAGLVGWKFANANTIEMPEHDFRANLLRISPAGLEALFQEAYQ